jgi:hypothetical protein
MNFRQVFFIFVFCAALCLAVKSSAQTSQGRISGQVTDTSGGAVANATVTIENLGTHVKRVLQTNSAGDYVAPSLEPGFYSIAVETKGFSKLLRERVQIEVANDLKIDFQLKPGAVNEVIEVKEETPLTETSNAVLNGVLSNKAINELPVQGRDFQNLLTLHPGVQRTPGGGFHSTSSNGNRLDDNNYLIDGANDNDAYWGETVVGDAGVQGTPASLLPLDAIQEFDTQEQPQADFGAKPGLVMNIGLKSGTNNIHGTAYYFHRNSAFDARNYFNPSPDKFSALLLHQFGASVGGPILKDKWFYFANYEGVRDKVGNPFAAASPVTVSLGGPTNSFNNRRSLVDARAKAVLDGLPISPLADKLVSEGIFLPNPGGTIDPNSPELIDFDFNNLNRADNLVFKSDYHPNSTNTISGRFFYANTNQSEEDGVPLRAEWLSRAIVYTKVFGADWTWTPSSKLQNQAAFSYNTFWEKIAPLDSNVSPKTKWGLDTGVTDPNLQGFPTISPGSLFNHMGGTTGWPLWTTPSKTVNISDTVSYTVGEHSLRFGGNYNRGGVDYFRGSDGRGTINFRHLEDFFTNTPLNGGLLGGDLKRNVHSSALAGFLIDDYRVTKRVTLNLGLRYDLVLPIKEDRNLIANFVPNVGIVQVGTNGFDSPYSTHYRNLSPRLGVAWDVFGNGKTVVRAAGGIIFEQPVIRTFVNSTGLNLNPSGIAGISPGNGTMTTFDRSLLGSDINFSGTGTVFNVAGGSSLCDNNPDNGAACSVFGTDPHLKTPYVANWNLNIQQTLSPTTLLQVAYVGNRGIKLYSNTDINQPIQALSAPCILSVDGLGPIDAFANVLYGPCEQRARPFTANCPVSVNPSFGQGLGGQCFPSLQSVTILGNQSSSIYHALQVTLTKRYSHGLYLLAGYTYAHAIDTATSNLASVPQNSLNYQGDRGNGDFDIRHRFTLSATYDLPSHKAPLQVLEGWQATSILTLEGGEPFTFGDSFDDGSATGEFSDRWNITGPVSGLHWTQSGEPSACDPKVQLCFIDPTTFTQAPDPTGAPHVTGGGDPRCISAAGSQAAVDQLGNTGCFIEGNTILTPPALGAFGNLGRNTSRGPTLKNLDFSISKVWKLNEKLRMQFRGELFNFLNHPNFDVFTLNSNVGTSAKTLGQVVATPDVGVANPVVGSGGSRHIQLGLKLVW